MNTTSVILAAGYGTRMHSNLPKVLHPLLGQPLVSYAVRAVAGISSGAPVVVVGHGAEAVRAALAKYDVRFAVQEEQLGTAHALMSAESAARGTGDLVLVTSADMPLFRPETLRLLVETQAANPGPVTITTIVGDDPHGFGRVIRAAGGGDVTAIVEEAAATPAQLLVREYNVGAYCFRADWLWDALHRVPRSKKGEFYLTDTVELAVAGGLAVKAVTLQDPAEAIGINTRVHLAEAEAHLRRRVNTALMLSGVSMIDPASAYIEPGVTIGRDTLIMPNTHLRGSTIIGEGCVIGPNTIIEDTRVGDHCTILASVLEQAVLEDHVEMGPFGHLRKGAHLAEHVHMGNFGEVKNSYLGPGTKMGHFSYIGDATIGVDVNIGAGTITCNFDGVHKHHTNIGDHVFIGSDTMLVAPLNLGENARTGAGAVVTKDVEANTVVVGVPARLLKKLDKKEE